MRIVYIQPMMESVSIQGSCLLAGSGDLLGVGSGEIGADQSLSREMLLEDDLMLWGD